MDLWVVAAAAAAAGYLSKHWQNVLQLKEGLSGFHSGISAPPHSPVSRSFIQEKTDKTCLIGNLSPRRTNGNENYSDCTMAQKSNADRLGTIEVTSTSSLDHGKQVEKHKDVNMPYGSCVLPSELRQYENYEYKSGYKLGSDLTEIPENHIWETGVSCSPRRRSRNALRNKCFLPLQFIKPRSSLDSCLVAQMLREHGESEDYVLCPLSSPCTPTLRPFLVTDGRRLTGRAGRDFRDGFHMEIHPETCDGIVGIPYRQQIGITDYSKLKLDKGKNQISRTSNDRTLVRLDSRDGSPPGEQFIFCLGISIGVMYTIKSIIAQKLEVENLKESLNQSKNLVQDLQEELEMKDSLTVKELVMDDSSQDAQLDTNVFPKYTNDDSVESMSKIEAELEAELERLELSMSGKLLHEREFDEDIRRRKSSWEPTPDRVSPHELSLRLHEVIESRLQDRILELEEELAKTQKRVYTLESERVNSRWEVWNSSESSSNPSTPITIEAHSPVAQPLVVMNLSGDALDAYNEAFEELSSNLKGTTQKEEPVRLDMTTSETAGEGPTPNVRTQIPLDEESPNYDEDDEDEDLLLIKQIVEKAKQGFPAILRAQRALVYLERGE